jgi:hypothetical protein
LDAHPQGLKEKAAQSISVLETCLFKPDPLAMQYLLLIHNNTPFPTPEEDWTRFFALARESGFFKGGSALNPGTPLGNTSAAPLSQTLGGYMRFDAEDRGALLSLLEHHPVARHGGTLELCEMPRFKSY